MLLDLIFLLFLICPFNLLLVENFKNRRRVTILTLLWVTLDQVPGGDCIPFPVAVVKCPTKAI